MCNDCAVKGLWHTDENQQLENFISGFTKKKKKTIYVRPAAPAAVAVSSFTITSSLSATIVTQQHTAQQPTAVPVLPQQTPLFHQAEQFREELEFIEPAGLGGDNPLA